VTDFTTPRVDNCAISRVGSDGTTLAMRALVIMLPSARVVLPLIALFWLLVALAAFSGPLG
jgi:hypothetical protein